MPKSAIWISLLVLLLISLPYVIAAFPGQPDYVFGGFLLNPQDGNTYLAKMYQGWRGDLRFTLPYSADPGRGGFFNLYYLFLGHLARWVGMPLILLFHLARLCGVVLMLLALWRFLAVVITAGRWRIWAFAFASLGLGLGWLAVILGLYTSDLWVSEAYPFLTAFTNPHFPLALALVLWLLTLPGLYEDDSRLGWLVDWRAGLAALLLSILSPFGVVIAFCILAGWLTWELAAQAVSYHHQSSSTPASIKLSLATQVTKRITHRLIWVALFGSLVVIYDLWATRLDPQLAAWNAQNLTLTPPAWDLMIAFSPVLLLALPGAWWVVRRQERYGRVLLVWALISAALIYFPLGVQRRFLMGLYIPLVGLAVYGLEMFATRFSIRFTRIIAVLAFGLALSTNLFILLIVFFGIQTRDASIYLAQSEAHAMDWLRTNTPSDALVLASPETGLLIPAHTGRRVIYGHAFETVDAEAERTLVLDFFQGVLPASSDFLDRRKVDYIFFGPHERKLGGLPDQLDLHQVYASGGPAADEVTIYQVGPNR